MTGFDTRGRLQFRLESSGDTPFLAIGATRIPLDDIDAVEREEIASRDITGLGAAGMVFTLAAVLVTVGVYSYGFSARHLVGASLLALLALTCLGELGRTSRVRHLKYRLWTRQGAMTEFTTPCDQAAAAFEAALQGRERRRQRL